MRAPCDSDSEQCNNIQYMPDDGGFYPKCLTKYFSSIHILERVAQGELNPLILTMAARSDKLWPREHVSHVSEKTSFPL